MLKDGTRTKAYRHRFQLQRIVTLHYGVVVVIDSRLSLERELVEGVEHPKAEGSLGSTECCGKEGPAKELSAFVDDLSRRPLAAAEVEMRWENPRGIKNDKVLVGRHWCRARRSTVTKLESNPERMQGSFVEMSACPNLKTVNQEREQQDVTYKPQHGETAGCCGRSRDNRGR